VVGQRTAQLPRAAGRIAVPVTATAVKTVTRSPVPLELEQGELPLNTYNNKKPFIGTVKSVEKITGPKATGETSHIIIETRGEIPFWEGQSYGVIPPVSPVVCAETYRFLALLASPALPSLVRIQGTKINSRGKEVPHGVRLYSIAASRYGDSFDGKTTSLCVRRAVYTDPETGKEDPAKKGICSNFLCDAKPGDEIVMTGEASSLGLCDHFRLGYWVECSTATFLCRSHRQDFVDA
jgi:ferredoxin--NADP+ reductase